MGTRAVTQGERRGAGRGRACELQPWVGSSAPHAPDRVSPRRAASSRPLVPRSQRPGGRGRGEVGTGADRRGELGMRGGKRGYVGIEKDFLECGPDLLFG